MTLRVDAVIPTIHRDHLLPKVVRPLLEDPVVDRVILVDDAPSGPSDWHEEISRLSDRIDIIYSHGIGPAGARQVGVEAARADIVFLVDDDVVPTSDLASRHARRHDEKSNLLVSGYTPVLPREGQELSAEATIYGIAYERRCKIYDSDDYFVSTHLWGGNLSLRRMDALAVGLASDQFPDFWHEDREFGLRCLEAGMKAAFIRELWAKHEHERTWKMVAHESYGRGYSLVRLHQVHESKIGPYNPHHYERSLPAPLRIVIRISSYPVGNWFARASARTLRQISVVLHAWRLQLISVRLLRRMQGARGGRDAMRDLKRS